MTSLKRQFAVQRGFVTNELLIAIVLAAIGIFGAVVLTRALHLGWAPSLALITVAIIAIFIGLILLHRD